MFLELTELNGTKNLINMDHVVVMQTVPFADRAELFKRAGGIITVSSEPTGLRMPNGQTLVCKESLAEIKTKLAGITVTVEDTTNG